MSKRVGASFKLRETVEMRSPITAKHGVKNRWQVECRDRAGNLKWSEDVDNLVVEQGINDFLTQYFKGSSYTATWFVGLKSEGSAVDGDTASSHSWSEFTSYNGVRKTLSLGTAAGKSLPSTSAAMFSITGAGSVAGGFLQTTNTGTGGVLYGVVDFATVRTVGPGDIINVNTALSGTSV